MIQVLHSLYKETCIRSVHMTYICVPPSSLESGSTSEGASCTSTDAMDESDSSSDHESTSWSPALVRRKTKKRAGSNFKETRKTKLNGSAAKRFFLKIKQRFTTRKLRRNLQRTEVAPLLMEENCSGSEGDSVMNVEKQKKSKTKVAVKRDLVPFSATDTVPLLDEGAESSDNESSSCSEREEEISMDVSRVRRKKQMSIDSIDSEMTDKKKRQNEARRLRRQKKKVPLIISSTPLFLTPLP